MITKLSGGSDDIIYHLTDGKLDSIDAINKKYMLFADGTVISGEYDRGGVWRFESVRNGSGALTLVPFSGEVVDDEYAADLCELTATDSRLIWSGMRPPKPHPHLVRGARVLTALAAAGLISPRGARRCVFIEYGCARHHGWSRNDREYDSEGVADLPSSALFCHTFWTA